MKSKQTLGTNGLNKAIVYAHFHPGHKKRKKQFHSDAISSTRGEGGGSEAANRSGNSSMIRQGQRV